MREAAAVLGGIARRRQEDVCLDGWRGRGPAVPAFARLLVEQNQLFRRPPGPLVRSPGDFPARGRDGVPGGVAAPAARARP
jgi:hypothetical protein